MRLGPAPDRGGARPGTPTPGYNDAPRLGSFAHFFVAGPVEGFTDRLRRAEGVSPPPSLNIPWSGQGAHAPRSPNMVGRLRPARLPDATSRQDAELRKSGRDGLSHPTTIRH